MTNSRSSNILKNPVTRIKDLVIGIKSAGEMATGIACRLHNANVKNIFMLETPSPLAVRRQVSFCETIYKESITVEGVNAQLTEDMYKVPFVWQENKIPIIVDPDWRSIQAIHPHVVIDAILAKKNLGTNLNEARLVIGLGPGFEAGVDSHKVIETNRGHDLGKIIHKGKAEPNTGIPGSIDGFTKERVLRAPCKGIFKTDLSIGTMIKKGDTVGRVEDQTIVSKMDGVVRGLIKNGTNVKPHLKLGDVDPRGNIEFCNTISEKARALGGSILETILNEFNQ